MTEEQSPPSGSTANRPDMVEAARQFMLTPKVQGTPFEEQKKFLLEKGVTEAEIAEAHQSIPSSAALPPPTHAHANPQPVYYQMPPATFGGKLYSATQSMVVIGGASYMAYKLVRTWLLPKFFNLPEPKDEQLEQLQVQVNSLQNSTKYIMDSVERTLQAVSAQQDQLSKALQIMAGSKTNEMTRLQGDVAIVKSLLLNQNQFPAIPDSTQPTNGGVLKPIKTVRWNTHNAIPPWQLPVGKENGLPNGKQEQQEGEGEPEESQTVQSDDEFLEAQNGTTA